MSSLCRNETRKDERRRTVLEPPNKKTAQGGLSEPDGDADQASSAPLFRRYAMKPTPQKPKIIMAQVYAKFGDQLSLEPDPGLQVAVRAR